MAVAVERQPEPRVGAVGDLGAHRGDAGLTERLEQRGKVGLWRQHQAHLQAPGLPVCRLDAVVPVELIGFERRLAIHFEKQRLSELAFGGERQDQGFAQHIRLAKAQHRRFAGRARDFGEA